MKLKLLLTALLLGSVAYNIWQYTNQPDVYLQDEIDLTGLDKFLLDPTIKPEHGKRIWINSVDLKKAMENHAEWKKRNWYKKSLIRTGDFPNRFNQVKTTTSFTYHIDSLRSLLNDIAKYDTSSIIKGIRVQLYESTKYKDNPRVNLVDGLILPTDINGNYITSVSHLYRTYGENIPFADVPLVINNSNPCPNYCD
jgi:hypothetical protein